MVDGKNVSSIFLLAEPSFICLFSLPILSASA